jgi:hypothetical protein
MPRRTLHNADVPDVVFSALSIMHEQEDDAQCTQDGRPKPDWNEEQGIIAAQDRRLADAGEFKDDSRCNHESCKFRPSMKLIVLIVTKVRFSQSFR